MEIDPRKATVVSININSLTNKSRNLMNLYSLSHTGEMQEKNQREVLKIGT